MSINFGGWYPSSEPRNLLKQEEACGGELVEAVTCPKGINFGIVSRM